MANYGGIGGENKHLQHNTFNQLYYNTNRNSVYQTMENNTRFHLDLTRKSYDNVINQLPNSFNLNGHIYAQIFKNPIQTIINREITEIGRNNSIYNAIYDRKVNVSGVLYDNNSIKIKPLIDGSKTFNNKLAYIPY